MWPAAKRGPPTSVPSTLNWRSTPASNRPADRGPVALPLVDSLHRSSHEHRLVALGQAFGIAERRDALLIGQHVDRPGPVGAPHAAIQPKRIDDPQHRLPDIVEGE